MTGNPPLRLLIVTGAFPARSQTFIEAKVVGLARRGHHVTVLALGRGDHQIDAAVRAELGDRLRVDYWPARAFLRAAGAAGAHPVFATRLARSIARRRPTLRELVRRLQRDLAFAGRRADVIHFEWTVKAAGCSDALPLLTAPTVVSCRGSDVRVLAPGDARLAAELSRVFAAVDAVHCVSDAIAGDAMRLGADAAKLFVNRPAVDLARFTPPPAALPAPPLRILSVGRLHWVKGYEHALQAVRLLVDEGHDVRYRIVGGGEPEAGAAVRFAVRDLGLENRVELAGARSHDEVRQEMAAAHVLLVSSVSEGLSNAALEGMAMALPVVTTDVGGMAELVQDKIDGYLVAARDPVTMADRLARLADDPELRARMGAAGRARVAESFTVEAQLERFVERYRRLLESSEKYRPGT